MISSSLSLLNVHIESLPPFRSPGGRNVVMEGLTRPSPEPDWGSTSRGIPAGNDHMLGGWEKFPPRICCEGPELHKKEGTGAVPGLFPQEIVGCVLLALGPGCSLPCGTLPHWPMGAVTFDCSPPSTACGGMGPTAAPHCMPGAGLVILGAVCSLDTFWMPSLAVPGPSMFWKDHWFPYVLLGNGLELQSIVCSKKLPISPSVAKSATTWLPFSIKPLSAALALAASSMLP